MRYRELLHKYKKGELDAAQKSQVEAEIERQEAISDFLVDQMEEIWEGKEERETKEKSTGNGNEELELESEELTQMINHSIRRAFFKMGAVITAVLLCVILFISFGLSPLVAKFYYNPAKIAVKDREIEAEINQGSLDYMIYSDLTMPGHYRDQVNVTDQGYGTYGIEICQTISRSNQFVNVGGSINRGKLTLYNTNALKQPYSSIFAGAGLDGEGTISEKIAESEKELNENERISHWFYASQEEGRELVRVVRGRYEGRL